MIGGTLNGVNWINGATDDYFGWSTTPTHFNLIMSSTAPACAPFGVRGSSHSIASLNYKPRYPALYRFLPPDSVRWVCLAGAGSGRRKQPPDRHI